MHRQVSSLYIIKYVAINRPNRQATGQLIQRSKKVLSGNIFKNQMRIKNSYRVLQVQ